MESSNFIILSCLNNKLRIKILEVLSTEPKTVSEIIKELGIYKPKYRQSVNRALEILRKCGIIIKEYDPDKKALFYSLKYKKMEIDLLKMEIHYYE